MNDQLKNYQLSAFFSPLLDEKQLVEAIDKIKKLIVGYEGKTAKEKISKKNLAYKIKHFQDAFYVLLDFSLLPDKVIELASKLKLEKDILRHLITIYKPETAIEPKKQKPMVEQRKDKTDLIDQLTTEKPGLKAERAKPLDEIEETTPKKEKVNLEDLDKKLDEILNE